MRDSPSDTENSLYFSVSYGIVRSLYGVCTMLIKEVIERLQQQVTENPNILDAEVLDKDMEFVYDVKIIAVDREGQYAQIHLNV